MNASRPDAYLEAERAWLEWMRSLTAAQRFAIMNSLSREAIEASRREILERRGDGNELEAKLEWVRLHYGENLERGLRTDLERRGWLPKPQP